MSVINCLNKITISDTITEVLSLGAISQPVQATAAVTFEFATGTSTAGTVANVIDERWELSGTNAVTLAASASVTYTLSALTDTEGRTISLARYRKLLIWLTSVTDGDYLSVGVAGTHPLPLGATVAIPVTGALVDIAPNKTGKVVAAGSADQLKIVNSGSASITFGINISGCST